MAEKTNVDSGNDEIMESPSMTTAKPVPLQKQPGEVNIESLLAKNRRYVNKLKLFYSNCDHASHLVR